MAVKKEKVVTPKKTKSVKTTTTATKPKETTVKISGSKKELIAKFGSHEKDTGSPQVQIALLTQEINNLQAHFQTHGKDRHSKEGLFKKVGARRKLLEFLKKTEPSEYQRIIESLGLRG